MEKSMKGVIGAGLLGAGLVGGLVSGCGLGPKREMRLPNVVVIYADDLGYGDLSLYGGQVPTPSIDRLGQEGLRFTHAYATAATCTPSRFSLLTGEYSWREPGRGVAQGDAPALIAAGRETWPAVMQRAGYQTGAIGKWHLGLGGPEGPDWNGKLAPGPLEAGFDYAFLIPATNDRVPTVFVENHRVVNLDPADPIRVSFSEKTGERPTGLEHPELLTTRWSHGHDQTIINGISRIGYMEGGEAALWRDEDIADRLVEKALGFIEQNKEGPFFLYLSTVDIHVPRIAHERFQGATPFGPRGDVIAQLDWSVGAILKALKELGLDENTIVIFTSDNGPVLDDGYEDQSAERLGGHRPWGPFRGGKYSAFEAGTRVPLLVRWPGHIEAGSTTEALFSQVDMLASFAAFLGVDYDREAAPDSRNHWEALTGKDPAGRDGLVQEAIQNVLSYVSADGFKYIPPGTGSPMVPWGVDIETGFSPEEQLYDLNADPGETTNIASQKPGKLEELKKALAGVVEVFPRP